MAHYNFKSIMVVPTATELIDITLSKTQRKTPTVVHPGYKITRIRNFYLRKVKFTQVGACKHVCLRAATGTPRARWNLCGDAFW